MQAAGRMLGVLDANALDSNATPVFGSVTVAEAKPEMILEVFAITRSRLLSPCQSSMSCGYDETKRRPALLMIDEAPNLCTSDATSPLQAAVRDRIIQIAAERRKYELWLLLSTPASFRKATISR